ncbi:DUF92 domain-containing protein [Halobacteriales archaeon QS_4_69_34]|nr:MAG: DUF92 domain-containing protein [Halobacteriales archaeon QS_4_69_34]
MTPTVRRAGAFVLVGALALAAPALGPAAPLPFAAVAVLAAFVVTEGPLFELFARPGDRRDGRLNGLAGFALAAAGLALLPSAFGMPLVAVAAGVLVLACGNFAEQIVRARRAGPLLAVTAFVLGGMFGGVAGQAAVTAALGSFAPAALPELTFLAASGALLAALLRSVLFVRDDPLVVLSVGLLGWLLAALPLSISTAAIAVAIVLTVGFGYAAYALGAASITGMLAGTLLGLLTVVLGGIGWFAMLVAFFGGGGLAAKFRYEEKASRGVAEPDGGARASGNVLANAAVALAAVLAAAASPLVPAAGAEAAALFRFAFAGSLAAALADTLSSEIGGLYDTPRLFTTLEPVPPGTDGGVTLQGTLAGLLGATVIGAIAALAFGGVGPAGAAAVVAAGASGMIVDSLLGATVEGRRAGSLLPVGGAAVDRALGPGPAIERRVDNRTVNFLATLAAALVCVALVAGVGLVPA